MTGSWQSVETNLDAAGMNARATEAMKTCDLCHEL
jgi:hypothetical protein